ncbi:MAG: phage tail protein [Saprospiraceae bacterium]
MAKEKLMFPIPKFFFRVSIDGQDVSFHEVSGLEVEAELMEYRVGASSSQTTMKKIGLIRTAPVIMKRGVFKTGGGRKLRSLVELTNNSFVKDGNFNTPESDLEVIISLLDEEGDAVMTWTLDSPIPIKYVGGDYNSSSSEIAIEQIEFVHEGITIEEK